MEPIQCCIPTLLYHHSLTNAVDLQLIFPNKNNASLHDGIVYHLTIGSRSGCLSVTKLYICEPFWAENDCIDVKIIDRYMFVSLSFPTQFVFCLIK